MKKAPVLNKGRPKPCLSTPRERRIFSNLVVPNNIRAKVRQKEKDFLILQNRRRIKNNINKPSQNKGLKIEKLKFLSSCQ